MKSSLALALLVSSLVCAAQQIPAGTILPVELSTTISSRKSKPGAKISAHLMQPVDLGSGGQLRAGTRVNGKILSVDPYHVTLTFDQAIINGKSIPIRTDLRALASMLDVEDAQLPTNAAGGDRGSSIQDWNTAPIGGDAVYNPYGGKLMAGDQVIGRTLANGGIVAKPASVSGAKCRGELDSDAEQAFWVFSPSACGVYGLNVDLVHSGRTNPVGNITLQSKQHFVLHGGSGMLLRVVN